MVRVESHNGVATVISAISTSKIKIGLMDTVDGGPLLQLALNADSETVNTHC
jgi:hypothetical protein